MMALLVGSAGIILAFTMAALSFSQLNLTHVRTNRASARNAAEAAVNLALAELLENPSFGKAKELVQWTSPDGLALGNVTFDREKADYSTNSLDQDVPTEGSQGMLPAQSVQLVGRGFQAGIETRVVVTLHVPPYPYALASSGVFESGGSMLVARLPSGANPTLVGQNPPDLSKLDPGNMASRSNADRAVALATGDKILGDVEAVGGIERGPAEVRGEVRPHDEVAELPKLDLDDFQPPADLTVTLYPSEVAARTTPLQLDGFYKSDALIVNSGMEMKSGVLFVNGDLKVNGPIQGKGAIFVRGKVELYGGAQLSADNQVALVSTGPVTMVGSGLSSNFQGLVYTEGGLTADRMSVTGAMVANSATAGDVRLTQAAAVSMPDLNFKKGWLAEREWIVDVASGQFVPAATGDSTVLKARGVATPDGGLKVDWHLGFQQANNGLRLSCLLRTDTYNLNGQLVDRHVHLDLSDDGPNSTFGLDGHALGVAMGIFPPGNEPLGDEYIVLGLVVAGICKASTELVALADNAPPLTPQQFTISRAKGSIELDFNSFIGLEDKLRVLQWKELY